MTSARSYAWHLSASLFLVGLVGGTLLDRAPERPVTVRDGYRVLEVDFHAHTRFSDGFLSPFDLVVQARRRGLDALAVTEHNLVFPSEMARWFSEKTGGPTILLGEEVTTSAFHVHGVGLTAKVDPNQPLAKILDDIHAQGGVAIAAHPVQHFWPAFVPVRDKLDAAEVMHPLAFGSRTGRSGWRWEQMRDFYEDARKDGFNLTAIGSSDYHFFSPLGVTRTLVFTDDAKDDASSVLDAVKKGRTVVYDLDGRPYGDPAMIAALQREPYAMRAQDYGYEGADVADRVTRVMGFVGFLGLVLFRRRSRLRAV